MRNQPKTLDEAIDLLKGLTPLQVAIQLLSLPVYSEIKDEPANRIAVDVKKLSAAELRKRRNRQRRMRGVSANKDSSIVTSTVTGQEDFWRMCLKSSLDFRYGLSLNMINHIAKRYAGHNVDISKEVFPSLRVVAEGYMTVVYTSGEQDTIKQHLTKEIQTFYFNSKVPESLVKAVENDAIVYIDGMLCYLFAIKASTLGILELNNKWDAWVYEQYLQTLPPDKILATVEADLFELDKKRILDSSASPLEQDPVYQLALTYQRRYSSLEHNDLVKPHSLKDTSTEQTPSSDKQDKSIPKNPGTVARHIEIAEFVLNHSKQGKKSDKAYELARSKYSITTKTVTRALHTYKQLKSSGHFEPIQLK